MQILKSFTAICLCVCFIILSTDKTLAKPQCGKASWYGLEGRQTASGELVRAGALTGAHRTLKFGTKVKVTNMRNGRSIWIRINDRGPFVRGRIIDVSRAAARCLGFLRRGLTRVCLRY